jgi:hypothetical protein
MTFETRRFGHLRWHIEVKLATPDDVDDQVRGRLERAYALAE